MTELLIVNEHHDILNSPSLTETKHLTLVNFDSHPDLGIPVDKHPDIGTWILWKTMDKTITEIYFVFFFSHAVEGSFSLALAKHQQTGEVKVFSNNTSLPIYWKVYWGIEEEVVNLVGFEVVTNFILHVTHLSRFNPKIVQRPYVLSIDLDFFDVVNPMFKEVDLLPWNMQYIFKLLTRLSVEESRHFNYHLSLSLLEKLAKTPKCISCEYSPTKQEKGNIKKVNQQVLHLFLQGSCQPHHPTSIEYRQKQIYPTFKQKVALLPYPEAVLIATSDAYRSTPNDCLLEEVLDMLKRFVV